MLTINELKTALVNKGFSDVTVKPSDSPGIAFTKLDRLESPGF